MIIIKELNYEDFARITSCVGAMSISLLGTDLKEAFELHKLHGKLISIMESANKKCSCKQKQEDGDSN